MFEKTTLSNGLRIVTHSMPSTYSVSASFIVGVGSRYEPAGLAGVSHFLEHMLFKGTKTRPSAKDVAETIEGVGGVLNAGTEKELTSFWAKVAWQHRSLALDLLVDMLRRSLFEPEEIEKERHVITEEIHMSEDVPQDLVNSLIDELIWPDHPLGREIAGTVATVTALPRPSLVQYLNERYVPNNTVLSVAGNVTHREIVDRAAVLLGDWQPRERIAFRPAPTAPGAIISALRTKDIEQAHLCISAGGLPRAHPDRRAQDVQNLILGGGMSSRLFLEIRERLALAYDVAAYLDYYADTGAAIIYAGTDPDQVDACVEAILDELRRLRKSPVRPDELTRAKEYFKGRMLLGMEDSYSNAHWLGAQELLTDRIQTVDEIIAEVDAVTVDDVQRVSNAVLNPKTLRLAVVGPIEDCKHLETALGRG